MRKARIFVLASAAVMCACHHDRSGTCVPISSATRVAVHISSPGTAPPRDYVITDSGQIGQLTAFANARREASQPLYTMPAPQMSADFYDKQDFVGSIGAGSNFFFVSCQNWKGIRNANDAEIAEFKRLTGSAK